MKKVLLVICMFVVVALITSCEKENDEINQQENVNNNNSPVTTPSCYVEYNGKKHEVKKMIILPNNAANFMFFRIYFAPSTVSCDPKGYGLTVQLVQPENVTSLPVGVFTNATSFQYENNALYNAMFIENNANWNSPYPDACNILTSSLKIEQVGSTYTFTFNGTDETGKTIKAYYTGAIEVHE
ncbi:MAG: hypothetical protein RR356_01530 [Bacteroidales bacterium]